MKDGRFITMGIESSCDETSIALVADGRHILSDVISSQISIHTKFGGVVPEIASRHHLQNINRVMERALEEADITLDEVDLIGVTNGPGLIGALVIGVAAAKALSFARDIPLVGVNHMHGHVSANYLQYEDLEPPFMALITSGGHTEIVKVNDYTSLEVLGGTRDDAVGECYDKVARVLGLGYPGGPKIDRIAKEGDPEAIHFKRVFLEKDSFDFSFSGLKTAVLNHLNSEKQAGREINRADVAASFQKAVTDVLVTHAMSAVKDLGEKRLVLAGGVASNGALRAALDDACRKSGVTLYCPPPILCTDNAAMIAAAGYYRYLGGQRDGWDLNAIPNLALG
ncbi:MAG TPA: tRNA (adenosine(37)-N6)-threonylcarbamoyltransferase complex transferase subunit TsaD [Eubacterium sp.]|nr:tRNA (adenosine(37)-N6)-threonylcarbamoyltransferase complex transferase subunit TsaD [Eubacterium sp.]